MAEIRLTTADPATLDLDALVVGATDSGDGVRLAPDATRADEASDGRLGAAVRALGVDARAGDVLRLPALPGLRARTLLAVVVPPPDPVFPGGREELRRAAGAAARALHGRAHAATTLAADGDPQTVRAVAEGFALGAYAYTRYRTERADSALARVDLVVADTGSHADTVERATVVADAVALCRDLVNTPPGDLHPAELAEAALAACTPLGLEVEVYDEDRLAAEGFGGILGVGAGSTHPPRLVRIAYRPDHPRAHVALVGKGITFDSGGLSLKPPASMETMKSDMGGAAAVIATLTAIARLAPPVAVTGWAPAAENMPSGSAIRPSDVLRIYGGKTVEVLNTDAEGRLILADALTRAAEDRPDVILDAATLTGAQLLALGSHVSAVMANDPALRARVVTAAGRCGEQMWPMPLPRELRKSLDTEIADLANMGERFGGMLVAGLFLAEFVPTDLPWAHLDIAGPAFNTGEAYGYVPKGATGAAVRTFVEFVTGYGAD